jgi:hypothetical protein
VHTAFNKSFLQRGGLLAVCIICTSLCTVQIEDELMKIANSPNWQLPKLWAQVAASIEAAAAQQQPLSTRLQAVHTVAQIELQQTRAPQHLTDISSSTSTNSSSSVGGISSGSMLFELDEELYEAAFALCDQVSLFRMFVLPPYWPV